MNRVYGGGIATNVGVDTMLCATGRIRLHVSCFTISLKRNTNARSNTPTVAYLISMYMGTLTGEATLLLSFLPLFS